MLEDFRANVLLRCTVYEQQEEMILKGTLLQFEVDRLIPTTELHAIGVRRAPLPTMGEILVVNSAYARSCAHTDSGVGGGEILERRGGEC